MINEDVRSALHIHPEWDVKATALARPLTYTRPMITQVRIYTINKGMMDSWIEQFNEHIVPTSARFGVQVLGAWVNRPQNEFVWVRQFDSKETLERYEQSPDRASYTPTTSSHIAKIEVREVENALLAKV